ncbi:carbohydrate binding domain-containing protein [Bacillus sp. CHD6a]|uniref:carbohydrate binding domain-containing protein n=1 Tax=Bacillus sp. CHD6a TaxID=1643452 RepID=UPI0006CC1C92|nr:carbohydrate binding domain-containing protein [Bacillus sp. CHD6a]KPB04766.1 beta-glucanase [Bacillus sp. CHD6a]
MLKKGFTVMLAACLLTTGYSHAYSNDAVGKGENNTMTDGKRAWQLVWEDNFEGTELDQSKWSYDTGNGFVQPDGNYVPGWGNEELQYYKEDNVSLEGGNLVLTGKSENASDEYGTYDYTSGKIHTKGKFNQKYGKFEAKIKMPAGQGYWPAFWMMPEKDKYGGWAASGEIDIMEAAGGDLNKVGGAIHYGSQWPNNTYTAKDYHFGEGTDITDFNVYSVEWEPGEIRWYVNDELFQTLNNWTSLNGDNGTKYSYPAPFDQEFYLIFNLAIGGWYGGGPNESTEFPGKMEVDYVKVYELPEDQYREPVEPVFEKEELPEGSKEPVNGNYIYDTAFEKGFAEIKDGTETFSEDEWNFVHLNQFGGNGSASVENGFAKIDIGQAGSQPHSIQLIQNVPAGVGRTYKVSFDAKAASNRNMNLKVSGGAERGWSLYSPNYEIALTPELQSYEYTYQMQAESDAKARLEFNMGLHTNSVWIGNVRVEEIDAIDPYNEDAAKPPLRNGNHIYNGTFDQGRMDRMTYWNLILNGADAQGYVEEVTRALRVDVKEDRTSDSVQLVQKGISIKSNNEYTLSFDASAVEGRDIQVAVLNKDGSVNYSGWETISLSKTGENKTFSFQPENADDSEAKLVFLLGGNAGSVTLDNVSMFAKKLHADVLSFEEMFPLKNGKFNFGPKHWNNHVQGIYDGPSDASFEVEDGKAVATIRNVGWNPWDVIFMQEGLQMKGGNTYLVSFDASSTLERSVEVVLEDSSYNRSLSEVIPLTPERTTHTFEVALNEDMRLGLKYLLGNVAGNDITNEEHQVMIDNVRVEVAGTREKLFPLKNGDFTKSMENWNLHVQGEYDGTSKARVKAKDEHATVTIKKLGENPWDIMFFQENLELAGGITYELELETRSNRPRTIEVVMDNGAPYYHRFFEDVVEIGRKPHTYHFEWDQPEDAQLGLKFLLGNMEGVSKKKHHIDFREVKLEAKGARAFLQQLEGTDDETE